MAPTPTYYTWSPIHTSKGVIKLGAQVSKSDVEDDADWDYLIESRVIRTTKYPADAAAGESPREFYVRQFAEQNEMNAELPGMGTQEETA